MSFYVSFQNFYTSAIRPSPSVLPSASLGQASSMEDLYTKGKNAAKEGGECLLWIPQKPLML